MKTRQIAIDGVASSGKSTIGRILAENLGYEFIDSGLLYRLATFFAIEKNLNYDNFKFALDRVEIDIENGKLFVNGKEFNTELLRTQSVDTLVSPVSADPTIRDKVTEHLRKIASNKNVVMVGRDIGSVVLKDAFLKIFLTATLEERALRRFKELISKGVNVTFKEVYENLKTRDMIDSGRSVAPLTIPKDAYVIDTTDLTIDEVIKLILTFLKGKEYALQHSQSHSDSLF